VSHRATCLLGLGLAACHTAWTETTEADLRLLQATPVSSFSGSLRVDVLVEPDETALLATVVVEPEQLIFFERVIAPDGEVVFEASDYWDSPRTRTYAAFSASVVTLNWPIDARDRPLEAGWWRFDLQMGTASAPVETTVVLKRDDLRLGQGSLKVNVLLAGDLADQTELVRGTTAAIDWWRDEIYAPMGIELQAEISSWDGPQQLQAPGEGDAESYLALARAKALDEVNVVVVDRVLGAEDVLGVAGSIPGALAATDRSAVTASALEAAGANRTFTRVEERLFGETLAHEVAHYLGLFHPVELPKDFFDPDTWDGLEDTPECAATRECESLLGANLMYPTPLCLEETVDGCVEFLGQTVLTTDQIDVAHRYTGVR
jgi:hypothetical protein